jgi:hypothetical protein
MLNLRNLKQAYDNAPTSESTVRTAQSMDNPKRQTSSRRICGKCGGAPTSKKWLPESLVELFGRDSDVVVGCIALSV